MTTAEREIAKVGGASLLCAADIKDFTEAKRKIYLALLGGAELSVPDLRALTGQDQADRRMRDLRADLEPHGFTIKRVHKGGRTWHYKLIKTQGDIFNEQARNDQD